MARQSAGLGHVRPFDLPFNRGLRGGLQVREFDYWQARRRIGVADWDSITYSRSSFMHDLHPGTPPSTSRGGIKIGSLITGKQDAGLGWVVD